MSTNPAPMIIPQKETFIQMLIYFHSFSLHLSVSRYCALLSFKVTPAFPFPALSLTAGARSHTREGAADETQVKRR